MPDSDPEGDDRDPVERPISLGELLRTGNNQLAMLGLGAFVGACLAIGVYAHGEKLAYSAAPPAVRGIFWLAGLGFVIGAAFSPNRSFRRPLGIVYPDGLSDWLFLAAVIGAAFAAAFAEIRLLS